MKDSIQGHFYDTEQKILYRGLEITVLPNVFVPRQISTVNGVSPKNIKMYHGKDVLDMGCGTGVQSIIAFKSGARSIISVDINPLACKNASLNFTTYNITNAQVLTSDLFQNIPEKFDSIVAYLPSIDAEAHDMRERAIYDQGFHTFERFLRDAKSHLNPDGVIYSCWVNIDNSIAKFHKLVEDNNYKILSSNMRVFEGEEWWMLDIQ